MATAHELKAAVELAKINGVRFPNESVEYRVARDALLAEEIELRRHIERVAQLRRALPPGGTIPKDYRFQDEHGSVGMSELFGDKQTLAIYSMMYGPQRKQPCPMCTTLLSAWDGEARDGLSSIARPKVAAPTGIRSSSIPSRSKAPAGEEIAHLTPAASLRFRMADQDRP